MILNIVLTQFLAAIFAVSAESGRKLNETEVSTRYIFPCPPPPVEGCHKLTDCLYADPKSCHYFYKCMNGISFQLPCPADKHGGRQFWDDTKKRCVSRISHCHHVSTTTTEPTTTTTEPTTTTTEPTTTTTEPTTTTTELTTTTTEPTTTPTEPTTTTPEPTTTTTELTIGPCQGYPDFCMGKPLQCLIPNPRNCTTYIQCIPPVGIPVEMPCPSGLEWNDNLKQCDWPSSSTCNSGTTLTPTNEPPPTTTEPPITTTQPTTTTTIACPETCTDSMAECRHQNPNECIKYFACHLGNLWSLICSPNEEWNDNTKMCENGLSPTCPKNNITPSY